MNLPYPACGNEEPHGPHPQFTADFSVPDCPGWTAEQQAVRHLVTSVVSYVQCNYAPGDKRPDGLRLEMHPAIRQLLMVDPALWDGPGSQLEDWFPVPVKVTTDLGKDQWRLVIVTEDVLLSESTA
jgi:hypothetical protein